jgi:hypothetical protein
MYLTKPTLWLDSVEVNKVVNKEVKKEANRAAKPV